MTAATVADAIDYSEAAIFAVWLDVVQARSVVMAPSA
jgi:hypothetical protein